MLVKIGPMSQSQGEKVFITKQTIKIKWAGIHWPGVSMAIFSVTSWRMSATVSQAADSSFGMTILNACSRTAATSASSKECRLRSLARSASGVSDSGSTPRCEERISRIWD